MDARGASFVTCKMCSFGLQRWSLFCHPLGPRGFVWVFMDIHIWFHHSVSHSGTAALTSLVTIYIGD